MEFLSLRQIKRFQMTSTSKKQEKFNRGAETISILRSAYLALTNK